MAADVSYTTHVDFDHEVAVCGELTEEGIVKEVTQKPDLSDDEGEDKIGDEVTKSSVPTSSEAFRMVENFRFIESQ